MSLKLNTVIKCLICVTALFYGCSESPVSGSETTSGVEISLVETTIFGTTGSGVPVMLFNNEYSTLSIGKYADTIVADDTGGFCFPNLPEGIYNIFVFSDSLKSTGAVLQDIPVGLSNNRHPYTDTQHYCDLRTIVGSVTLQQQTIPDAQVIISGSPFSTRTNSEGMFMFTNLPEGKYSVVIPPVRSLDGDGNSSIVDFTGTNELTIRIDFKLDN